MPSGNDRIAELEAEVDALIVEIHELREAMRVIHHYSAPQPAHP